MQLAKLNIRDKGSSVFEAGVHFSPHTHLLSLRRSHSKCCPCKIYVHDVSCYLLKLLFEHVQTLHPVSQGSQQPLPTLDTHRDAVPWVINDNELLTRKVGLAEGLNIAFGGTSKNRNKARAW